MQALPRAIEICGGQKLLAEQIGVTQGRVSQWIAGELIPVKYFPRIVRATAGEVTAEQLLCDELTKLEKLEQAVA